MPRSSGGQVRAAPPLGLALFLRRGLPAWVGSWGRISPPPTQSSAAFSSRRLELLPLGLHAEAAVLLTNMALGSRREAAS